MGIDGIGIVLGLIIGDIILGDIGIGGLLGSILLGNIGNNGLDSLLYRQTHN